jgi:hypothetical protein
MLSGYGQENQTVADYSGRQIVELMQNADDDAKVIASTWSWILQINLLA